MQITVELPDDIARHAEPKDRQIYDHAYSIEDRNLATLRELEEKGLLPRP